MWDPEEDQQYISWMMGGAHAEIAMMLAFWRPLRYCIGVFQTWERINIYPKKKIFINIVYQ